MTLHLKPYNSNNCERGTNSKISSDDDKKFNYSGVSVGDPPLDLTQNEESLSLETLSLNDKLDSKVNFDEMHFKKNGASGIENKNTIEPEITFKIIPWGKYRGMIDYRSIRCDYHLDDMNCHCQYQPIVPSKLRQVSTIESSLRQRQIQWKQVSKRKSFSNLSLQLNNDDDENTTEKENSENRYLNHANTFRKKLQYYKEFNGFKLRRHSSAPSVSSNFV